MLWSTIPVSAPAGRVCGEAGSSFSEGSTHQSPLLRVFVAERKKTGGVGGGVLVLVRGAKLGVLCFLVLEAGGAILFR